MLLAKFFVHKTTVVCIISTILINKQSAPSVSVETEVAFANEDTTEVHQRFPNSEHRPERKRFFVKDGKSAKQIWLPTTGACSLNVHNSFVQLYSLQ